MIYECKDAVVVLIVKDGKVMASGFRAARRQLRDRIRKMFEDEHRVVSVRLKRVRHVVK